MKERWAPQWKLLMDDIILNAHSMNRLKPRTFKLLWSCHLITGLSKRSHSDNESNIAWSNECFWVPRHFSIVTTTSVWGNWNSIVGPSYVKSEPLKTNSLPFHGLSPKFGSNRSLGPHLRLSICIENHMLDLMVGPSHIGTKYCDS